MNNSVINTTKVQSEYLGPLRRTLSKCLKFDRLLQQANEQKNSLTPNKQKAQFTPQERKLG